VASVGDDSAHIGVRNRTVAFIFFFVEVKNPIDPLDVDHHMILQHCASC
jgi:hypothetical protein